MNTQRSALQRGPAVRTYVRFAILPLLAANLVFAQSADTNSASASTDDQVLKLEKFEVTGSYLPPAANSVAIPVITVDNNSIQNSGTTSNLLEVLRKTVPQFNGNANLGNGNANVAQNSTQGGSQLALYNLATLVLINGRRAAVSPVTASGGYEFVDVNMIPLAAIDRVEVLPDGASAIYGSEAVAGVVNIILKSNYQGFEVGAHYGVSPNTGRYEEKTGWVVGGTSNGKTSITVSAEWTAQTPIYNWQRPYSAVTYGTPTFAGSVTIGSNYYYLDPSITTPTVAPGGTSPAGLVAAGTYSGPRSAGDQFTLFNLSQYVTQTIAFTRNSFVMDFDHEINDYMKAGGDFLFTNTSTMSQINGQPINTSQTMVDLGVGVNAAGTGPGSLVPAGQYGNPFNVPVQGRNRLVLHPRQYFNDSYSARGVFYLLGKIGESGWTWQAGADYNRTKEDYSNPGVINQQNLDYATAVGDFNWFSRAPITDAALAADQPVGTATGGFTSQLEVFDFSVRGKLFDLPGGPAEMALGGDIRREMLDGVADPLSQINPVTGVIGWNGAVTLYPFTASRSVKSEFAEVRIPIAKDVPGAHLLEASAAVRHEEYSGNTGKPTVPKFTLRYLPLNDEFALRANYSKSFAAPTLFALYGPVSEGYTAPFTLNAFGGGSVSNFQAQEQDGSNPNLKPTSAKSYSFGAVYSPKAVKGFSISLDYFNIKQTDLISSIGASTILQSVEDLGPASPYINAVNIGGFNNGVHPTAPGQISVGVPDDFYVTNSSVNIARLDVSGLNATIKYTWNADTVGRFDIASNIGYYENYTAQNNPDTASQQYAGTSTSQTLGLGTLPRWIAYTSVDYSRGKYGAFLGWRHIPGVHDLEDDSHTSDFDTIDLVVSYTFGSDLKYLAGSKVSLGVNNVFNKFGPLDPASFSDSNVDIGTYGAVGRMYYVNFVYKF